MIGHLLKPELEELIQEKRWDVLREALSHFHPSDIAEILTEIPEADDVPIFRVLPRDLAGAVFAHLPPHHQETLLRSLTNEQMRSLLNDMTPDDQTRLLEELPPEVTRRILAALSPAELKEARDLLGYRKLLPTTCRPHMCVLTATSRSSQAEFYRLVARLSDLFLRESAPT